jgi:hypothetical protein
MPVRSYPGLTRPATIQVFLDFFDTELNAGGKPSIITKIGCTVTFSSVVTEKIVR